MNSEQRREERAFEALVVDTLRRERLDEVDVESLRDANEKELAALKLVGGDFVERLIAGNLSASDCEEVDEALGQELAMAGEGVLFRSENIDEETAKELDEADRRIIERKKK